jgi:hypothetical protein
MHQKGGGKLTDALKRRIKEPGGMPSKGRAETWTGEEGRNTE